MKQKDTYFLIAANAAVLSTRQQSRHCSRSFRFLIRNCLRAYSSLTLMCFSIDYLASVGVQDLDFNRKNSKHNLTSLHHLKLLFFPSLLIVLVLFAGEAIPPCPSSR